MTQASMLSTAQLDRLREIDTASVANAVDALGVRSRAAGFTSLELRCMNPDLPPIVGYAVTCTEDTTTPRVGTRTGYESLLQAVVAAPKPAVVVFKALGQDRLRSCHLGDMMSTLLQRLGVVAVVTDGAVRDVDSVRKHAPGFQLFACGTVVGAGDYSLVDIGVTVSICGLTIAPGDLLHGDSDGLVSIPHGVADRVPAQAQQMMKKESDFIEFVRGPDFSLAKLSDRFGAPWS